MPADKIGVVQSPRSSTVRVARLLLAGWLAATAASQDPAGPDLPRAKVFGAVRTAAGQPWVGADVTLITRPFGDDERIGEADRVEARTDERGRFRAMVLPGRPYSVWAQAAVDGGGYRVTGVAEKVFAKVPVVLDEDEDEGGPRLPAVVRLHGLDAWQGRAPLQLLAWSETDNVVVVPLQPNESEDLVLPALPGSHCVLEVRGADGFPIMSQRLPLVAATATEGRVLDVRAPAPKRFGIAVRDIDTEKGIPGARIFRSVRDQLLPVGQTDADGFVVLELPQDAGDQRELFVLTDGYAPAQCLSGPETRKQGEWPKLRLVDTAHFYCHLGRGFRLEGRILLAAGRPAAGLTLVVDAVGLHYIEKNSRHLSTFRRIVRTDDDGRFSIPSVLGEYPARVHAVLDPRHIRELPEAWREGLCPIVFGLIVPQGRDGVVQGGDIRLSDLVPVQIDVARVDGVPADRATLSFAATDQRDLGTRSTDVDADRDGRLSVLLPAGDNLAVAVSYEQSFDVHGLRIERTAGAEAPARLEIALRPPWHIKGRAVDGADDGLEGFRLRCFAAGVGGRRLGGVAIEVGDDGEGDPRPDGARPGVGAPARHVARLVPLDHGNWLYTLLRRKYPRHEVTTDAEGRFDIEVPPTAMLYRVTGEGVDLQVMVDGELAEDLVLTPAR